MDVHSLGENNFLCQEGVSFSFAEVETPLPSFLFLFFIYFIFDRQTILESNNKKKGMHLM